MKKTLTILFCCLFAIYLPREVAAQKNTFSSYKSQAVSYRVFQSQNHTYGYDIFINNTLFIHQPVIPCITGNKGFKTKADAKKIALLVIEKIHKGIIPPSVEEHELNELQIRLK